MTSHAASVPVQGQRPSLLFAVTVFTSALLVFLVQPMIGKLLLPLLGGAPAVWNTSLAFFQAALLAGYAYAHALQRLPRFRLQVGVHAVVLLLAGLTLPLGITGLFGAPDPQRPVLWMLGVLLVSVGAPFAALSATAPLIQAWFALTARPDPVSGKAPEPYALYAASNLGSLLALVAYPVIIEPLTQLTAQGMGWSLGYGFAAVMIITLGLSLRPRPAQAEAPAAPVVRPSASRIALWIGLAAIPSSLMMGVTTYLSTDVASAPFLWVVPLALYLVTFIIAFSARPRVRPGIMLMAQAAAVCLCLYVIPFRNLAIPLQLAIHLLSFFLTALMCHAALARARPDPAHLTLYYLCLSIGGVIGGSFNAFVAPVLFSTIIEYPLVLALACLVRPWSPPSGQTAFSQREVIWLAFGLVDAIGLVIFAFMPHDGAGFNALVRFVFATALICAFAMRNRAPWMAAIVGLSVLATQGLGQTGRQVATERSFFGVVRIAEVSDPVAGPVRRMTHGTTLHGAQALTPERECQPLTYYTPGTAIGQAVTAMQSRRPAMNMAVVGLGVGTLSAYVREGDRMSFHEIDPTVVRMASNPAYFTFTSRCAKGPVSFRTGDARLTLRPLPAGQLDLLVVDAFSSDAVPAHLLTKEAIAMYLSKVTPDGLLLLHLSNRHLELRDPVIAAITAAGGPSLTRTSTKAERGSIAQSPAVVVIASPTEAGLQPFRADPRWQARDPGPVRPWTDDYTNLIGAMLAKAD